MGAAPSWVGTATARAGVAGNPSDALGGAALAVPVPALTATVTLRDADAITVRDAAGARGPTSVSELVRRTGRLGHDGAERLVTATIVTLHRWLVDHDRAPDDAPFEVEWSTDIPRSVGLAGSSALVIATLRALCARWRVELTPEVTAQLALRAEVDELGIAAGWMDRAVQALGAPTLVDRRVDPDAEIPRMEVVEPGGPIELVVAWDPRGASPSGRLHGSLRARLDAGEPEVVRCIDALVSTARRAATALRAASVDDLVDAVDQSCALRDRLGALDDGTRVLVEAARAAGGVATSAGSGGAVLIVPRRRDAAAILAALGAHDVPAVAVTLGTPVVPAGPRQEP